MYRCQICNKKVPAKTPSLLIPRKIRKRTYPFRAGANKHIDPGKPGKRHIVVRDDPGGSGYEIVEEIRVCASCASKAKAPDIE